MKVTNPLVHISIAVAILVICLLLFSFLPGALPAPEPLSPPTYLAATILCAVVLLLLRRKQLWTYLPIPLISLFAFLEESSYGVESGAVQPLTWERHNVPVYDLHNFIGVLNEVIQIELADAGWDFELGGQLLLSLLAILIVWLLFIGLYWLFAKRDRALPTLHLGFLAALSLAGSVYLLSLPADARGSLLFGYSAARLLLVGGLLGGGFLPFWLWRQAWFSGWLASKTLTRRLLPAALWLAALAGLAFVVWAPLDSAPDKAVLVQRLAAPLLWLLAASGVSGLVLLAASGRLTRLGNWLDHFRRTFFQTHPAYIYVVAAIVIIVFAQAMDRYLISFNDNITMPHLTGEDWDYWIEETLELCGAYLFLAATVVLALPGWQALRHKKKSP